jgi:hypothetical protein
VTAHAPTARFFPTGAADTTRGRLVLFGGGVGSTFIDDTWEYGP